MISILDKDGRDDMLTAQKIDVAIVLKEMMSLEDAEAFLIRNRVEPEIIQRVLHSDSYRSSAGHLIQDSSARRR